MRILELTPSLVPGGAERFTVDLANELSKHTDNQIILLNIRQYRNSDFYKNDLSTQINYIQDNGSKSFISKIFQPLKVLYWIFKLRPDIVHTHTVGINWLLLPSLLYPKAEYFFTVHNLAEQECTTKLGYYVRTFLFKRNVKAITISDFCKQSFKKFYGYECYKKIDNGCRELKTTEKLNDVIEEIKTYKIDINTKVFINVARFMPQKNHQLLIRAFNKFIQSGKNAILLIIGDYEYFPNTKEKLTKLVNTDRIHFLGTRTNVFDYLSCSDYYCLSSSWEGLPISLLEAGFSGCLPISTPAGGVVDVIQKEMGILTEDFTEESYLKALNTAYTIKHNREKLRSLYYKKYSMKICADKYNTLFKQLKQ